MYTACFVRGVELGGLHYESEEVSSPFHMSWNSCDMLLH